MRRYSLFVLFALFAAAALLAVGCSDDDDSGTTPVQTGDLSDPDFQYFQGNFATTEDLFDFGSDLTIAVALGNATIGVDLGKSPSRTGPIAAMAAEEDTVTSTTITSWSFTDDNWLVVNFSLTLLEIDCEDLPCDTSTIEVTGVDSIQYMLDGVVLDSSALSADTTINGIQQRAHVTYEVSEGGGASISAEGSRRLLLRAVEVGTQTLLQADAVLNESAELVAVEDSGTCTINLSRSQVVTGMQVNPNGTAPGGCPLAGSASLTDAISVSCTGTGENEVRELNIDGTWTVAANVNTDRSVTVTFVSNNVQWQTTVPNGQCD